MRVARLYGLALALAVYIPLVGYAVTGGYVETFESGSVEGWQIGIGTGPVHVPNAGVGGSGDDAIQLISTGGSGPGSRLVMFNTQVDYTGDYLAAGVGLITMDVLCTSGSPLHLRLAFEGATGGSYLVRRWWNRSQSGNPFRFL